MTEPTMVERAARAICQAMGKCKYAGGEICNTGRCAIDPLVARAAIATLRVPNAAMVEACARATDPDAWEADGPRWRQPGARLMASLGLQDAIDAALADALEGTGTGEMG